MIHSAHIVITYNKLLLVITTYLYRDILHIPAKPYTIIIKIGVYSTKKFE